MTMSLRILKDMKSLRPTSWIYWQAVDGGGWGLLKNALPDGQTTGYTLNKKYFVMANYSRFIRPGYRLIAISDPSSLAAYEPCSGTLVIVTTNSQSTDVGVAYGLSAFDAVGDSAAVYRTSPTEDLEQLADLLISDQALTAVAAARSVTTYVLSGVAYTGSVDSTAGGITKCSTFRAVWCSMSLAARPPMARVSFNGMRMVARTSSGPSSGSGRVSTSSSTATAEGILDITGGSSRSVDRLREHFSLIVSQVVFTARL